MRYKLGWSRLILAALWVTAVSAAPASTVSAASIPSALAFTPVASGLSLPVFVTNAGDGSNRLFIVQQGGQIRIFKNGSLLPTPFLNIVGSVSNFTGVNVEQGLLCLVFDPNYSTNGTFYITYTTTNPDPTFIYTTTLARYHVSTGNPDVADVASGVVLLSIPKKYTNHNGGMLAFGPDGYLYMSMGDGGSGGDPDNNAQNLHTMLGKLLRLDVESTPPVGKMYVIPPTNPFFASSDPNVKQEIWAYGLRNPWRFSFDRLTGDLYIGDVGQATEEEVDFQASASAGGQDYGWHILEGNLCYSPSVGCVAPSGYVPPVATYDHGVNASFGCAITGGYVYRGGASPSLQGVYLYGDYCSGKVLGLVKNASSIWTSSLIVSTGFTISSFGQDEQGELYLADYGGGTIYRISAPWIGGVSLTSDRNVVAVGRPQIGSQVMAYDGFATGNTTFYVPMLFRNAFGGTYNAALYVQNVDPVNTANITLSYYDTSGNLTCSHADSIPAFSSHGYWMPSECVPDGWVGGVVITADHNVVAVGRPQIGAEITSYDGFPSGSTSMYVPMLFRNAFGGTYNAALYVQNTDPSNTANITIQYYDTSGNPTCSHMDTIPALASHGYWLPTECMPDSWVGGAVVTADHNIVAVGRPHIGGQVTQTERLRRFELNV